MEGLPSLLENEIAFTEMNKQITVHMPKLSPSHQTPHFVPDFFDKPVCSPFWYGTIQNRGQHKVQHHRFYIHKWTVQFFVRLQEFFFYQLW